jgi:hypothetical protein
MEDSVAMHPKGMCSYPKMVYKFAGPDAGVHGGVIAFVTSKYRFPLWLSRPSNNCNQPILWYFSVNAKVRREENCSPGESPLSKCTPGMEESLWSSKACHASKG